MAKVGEAAMYSYGPYFAQPSVAGGMNYDSKVGQYAQPAPQGPAIASWALPTQAPVETVQDMQEAQCRGQRGFFAGRESVRSRARGKAVQSMAAATPQRMPLQVTPSDQSKQQELAKMVQAAEAAVIELGQDSDGEELFMCPLCRLPMGDRVCRSKEGAGAPMHGECMAQFALLRMKAEEEARQREDAAIKAARHREHGIGWTAALVPRGLNLATRLDGFAPQGMVCVVLEENNTVRLAPTCDPAAAVNLEYLLLALQVKRSTGREARFSLDPSPTSGMQVKRFEPAWLSGTSAGEVLFQADYYLKELSMGEQEQPVVGMRSCFDIAVDEGIDRRWAGREWFILRKAEVQLSEDNVLVPTVKMGVEAREQVQSHNNGFHDAAITRPDHPLVKYAEMFTRNFDLIAERKGAVHHLREFAKASCLAKFLLEAGAPIKDSWFTLADEKASAGGTKEIPSLWSERAFKMIRMTEDGSLANMDDLNGPQRIAVYGGVELELGQTAPPAWGDAAGIVMGFVPVPGQAAAVAQPGAVAAAVPGAGVARAVRSRRQALKMRATRRGPRVLEGAGLPQGVDLNLDSFDLDAGLLAGRRLQAPEACAPMGQAFWSEIASAGGAIKDTDKQLLRSIFNPHLADRHDEGDRFAPPDVAPTYVEKLRALVRAEDAIRQQRREHFLSADFSAAKPGPLFPAWASRYQLERADAAAESEGALEPRPDYKPSRESLRSAKPIFDKVTEDGTRFRIYRPGSVEVRTIQEVGAEETIDAVFSVAAPARTSPRSAQVEDSETIAKVTTYVESETVLGKVGRRYYTVLKTSKGNLIATEQRRDGSVAWEENPRGLEVRNSLAKVLCAEHPSVASVTLKDVKVAGPTTGARATASQCKQYALETFRKAGGKLGKPLEGLEVVRQGKTAKIA